jgi:hypothetical protein
MTEDDALGTHGRLVEKIALAQELARAKGLSFTRAYLEVLTARGEHFKPGFAIWSN